MQQVYLVRMKPKNFIEIPKITRSAIREIPKTWQSLNKTYLQPVTKKEVFRLNVAAIFVGLFAGYTAIGFRYIIGLMQNMFMHHQIDYELISPIDHIRGPWILLILPFGMLISTLLTHFFASEAKGHGVPEVIESVMTKGGRMRKRLVAIKALASSVTIAAGGSVGREGPIVQIGSALGSSIGQLLRLDPKLLKVLVGCGAAGAVGATFNTPIAGVIFAIEIIVLELKTKSFVPLVISSVFATVVSRYYLGNEPAFIVPKHPLVNPNELFFYLGLGVLSGIIGVLTIKVVYAFEDYFDELKIPFWSKPIIGGFILALICLQFPQMLGVGYETVTEALHQNMGLGLMAFFVFLKIFSTSLTLAAGGSGGVFAPSMFIGAMLGGAVGYIANLYFPEISGGYGGYALVGMAALFSATARATFTAIVILFEMTLDYSIILPLMFACVAADQVAWAISKYSIYSLKLKRKGINFVNDISVNVMSITLVSDIMTTDLHVATEEMCLRDVYNKLSQFGHTVIPVVDKNYLLTGVLLNDQLEKVLKKHPKMKVRDAKQEVQAIVRSDDTALKAITKIEKTRDPRVMVIDPNTNKLVGIVSPIDFVRLSSKVDS